MTSEIFVCLLEERISKIREVLENKAKEYSSDCDTLHNFKMAGKISRKTPAQALVGMMVKQWVSIIDMVEEEAKNGFRPPVAHMQEKFGDSINYLILLEVLLRD